MSADYSEDPQFHLYSYFRSSCSARLRIACNLKQIPLTYSYINLLSNDQSSASYTKVNPSKSVPTLTLHSKAESTNGPLDSITQSLAALEYLEEAFPDRHPLLPPPSNPLARAQARTLANIVACDVQPVTNLRILNRVRELGGDAATWAKDFVTEGLLAYEAIASKTAGKFSVGDEISIADACLVPAVWGAQRWGVDLSQMPVSMRVYENLSKIEEVDRAHWQRQEDTPETLRRKDSILYSAREVMDTSVTIHSRVLPITRPHVPLAYGFLGVFIFRPRRKRKYSGPFLDSNYFLNVNFSRKPNGLCFLPFKYWNSSEVRNSKSTKGKPEKVLVELQPLLHIKMSWLPISEDSPFSIANIPFGVISTSKSPTPHIAVAIGDHALDLKVFTEGDGFSLLKEASQHLSVFQEETLNSFASLGQAVHRSVRTYLQAVLSEACPYPGVLRDNEKLRAAALIPLSECQTHLPMRVGDYTDFYAGLNHAFNVGVLFRGKDNALQPNYKHLPVGYHGRASTVVVSGTPIRRPTGQILENPAAAEKVPVLSPCKKLDIELELGAFVCGSNKMGDRISIQGAKSHIFGLVLMNDWSARDIQAWEYVPLGPFLSKSFGTTISPWVVLTDALEPFLVQGLEPGNRDSLLPYLREDRAENVYDIRLQVDLITEDSTSQTICKTSGKNLLFSFPQMLAHHTINGCAMTSGDLLGSGTISGTEPGSQGSMLEQTKNGKEAISLGCRSRTFLEDGDEVVIRGMCGKPGGFVGFGECRGRVEPTPTL